MDYLQYGNITSGLPSLDEVLNLIINGLPSISFGQYMEGQYNQSFKPYYKWITFNM